MLELSVAVAVALKGEMDMRTRESEEMYLETILLLKKKKADIRSVDIVDELNYAKSSVSRAVNLLKERGYILVEDNGVIKLTDAGTKRAQDIYDRHRVITELLIKIGADRDSAEDNACRIEHVISDDLFIVMRDFLEKK